MSKTAFFLPPLFSRPFLTVTIQSLGPFQYADRLLARFKTIAMQYQDRSKAAPKPLQDRTVVSIPSQNDCNTLSRPLLKPSFLGGFPTIFNAVSRPFKKKKFQNRLAKNKTFSKTVSKHHRFKTKRPGRTASYPSCLSGPPPLPSLLQTLRAPSELSRECGAPPAPWRCRRRRRRCKLPRAASSGSAPRRTRGFGPAGGGQRRNATRVSGVGYMLHVRLGWVWLGRSC